MTRKPQDKPSEYLTVLVDLVGDDTRCCGSEYYCHLIGALVGWDGKEILSTWQWNGDALSCIVFHVQGDTGHAASSPTGNPLYSTGGMELSSRYGYVNLHTDQVAAAAKTMSAIDRRVDAVYKEHGSPQDSGWALVRWIRATGAKHVLFRGRGYESKLVEITTPADIAMRVGWLVQDWCTKHEHDIAREKAALPTPKLALMNGGAA